jgi:hypothetical protein
MSLMEIKGILGVKDAEETMRCLRGAHLEIRFTFRHKKVNGRGER